MTLPDTCRNHFPGYMLLFLLAASIIVMYDVSASPVPVTEKSLCAALPVAGDLYPGLYWETNIDPFCSISGNHGSADIMYYGYDTAEKKNLGAIVRASVSWYAEEVSRTQEFMTSPSVHRDSIRSRWGEYGSLEDIPDIEGGILLCFPKNAGWYDYQVFFLRSAGLYGVVKVEGNNYLERLGIDPEEYGRSEVIRLAELVYSRLPGTGSPAASSPSVFQCPIGGDAPLAIDPKIPGRGLCRGACGSNCPPSCRKLPDITLNVPSGEDEYYACTYSNVTLCGSHAGCRDHDACYDRCVAEEGETDMFGECHKSCNSQCTDTHGYLNCTGWIAGYPPYDQNLTYSDPPVASGPFTGPMPVQETAEISSGQGNSPAITGDTDSTTGTDSPTGTSEIQKKGSLRSALDLL